MANGYCPALLRHVTEVANGNSAVGKIHVAGFLKMLFCCQNSSVNPINDGFQSNSHRKTLTVAYRQRPTLSHVQDTDDCDINRIPTKAEWTLPNLLHKQTTFYISDSEIQQYCDEASRTVMVGLPATAMMQEHFSLFVEHANILLKAINDELVAEMSTQFGKNVTTNSEFAKAINIARNGQTVNLTDGIIEMMNDLRENEICDDPCMVGGGLMASYDMIRMAQGLSQSGIDASRLPIPSFWYDKETQNVWGTDSVGVFAKGSVKFLSYNKYLGAFAGSKGSSIFFTAPFPVNEFTGCVDMLQCLRDLRLDVQMKYIDCPTVVDVNGVPTTVNRGWQVILSKEFQLWVQPNTTNEYAAGDPLYQTNGTLLYEISNNCEDCDTPTSAYGTGY